jgi:hypothetical protein
VPTDDVLFRVSKNIISHLLPSGFQGSMTTFKVVGDNTIVIMTFPVILISNTTRTIQIFLLMHILIKFWFIYKYTSLIKHGRCLYIFTS